MQRRETRTGEKTYHRDDTTFIYEHAAWSIGRRLLYTSDSWSLSFRIGGKSNAKIPDIVLFSNMADLGGRELRYKSAANSYCRLYCING